MPLRSLGLLLAFAGALELGGSSPAGAQTDAAGSGSDLTDAERDLARQIAEQDLTRQKLRTDARIYAVDFELIVPKNEKGEAGRQRLARVTHYRYDGDLAIVSYVDLAARRVVQRQTVEHPSVPVSQEEFDLGKALFLKDAKVQRLIGANAKQVVPEALLMNFPDAKDPLYGHRVLRFVLRQGTQYLRKPVAWVDLTAQTVTIEKLDADDSSAH